MSKLHLNRERRNLGQFSPEEVAHGLADGRFQPTDLAWRDGMATWLPLSEITDLPVVAPVPAFEESSLPSPFDVPVPIAETTGDFPWERRGSTGVFPAIMETISGTLGGPTALYRRLSAVPEMGAPYFFYLLIAMLAAIVYAAETIVLADYWVAFVSSSPQLSADPQMAKMIPLLKPAAITMCIFFVVCVVPAFPFVAAGIYHLLLMLFGGAKSSFLTTFATTCYVFGAVSPLMILPCFCVVIVPIWSAVAMSLALAVTHRTETWRTALSVVIPLLFCCGGYLGLNIYSFLTTGFPR